MQEEFTNDLETIINNAFISRNTTWENGQNIF